MRLKNQKLGPLTLRKIDFAPNLSEETLAFTAMLKIKNVGEAEVRNDGRGGPNCVRDLTVEKALEDYCKTLPNYILPGPSSLSVPMNGDLLISLLIDRALDQKAGMPCACDQCGDTNHLKLNQRKDLPGIMRKGKLWVQCICDKCNQSQF